MTAVALEQSTAWPGYVAGGRGSHPVSVLDHGSLARADLVRPVAELGRRAVPPLSVRPELQPVLPEGLRRGSTVSVANSVSLVLAVLGGVATDGAWSALVGLPAISAEAAAEYGVDLERLAIVPAPGSGWLTAVGALLDAVDVVVVRPPDRVSDAELRRLSARARTRDAVLIPYLSGPAARWPRADCTLELDSGQWEGLGSGYGRLRQRRVTVRAGGRGAAGRPRSTTCWLPATGGGLGAVVDDSPAPPRTVPPRTVPPLTALPTPLRAG